MNILMLGEIGLSIPAWQMALFIGLVSLFVLQGSRHLVFTVIYLFVLYWGFVLYGSSCIAAAEGNPGALTFYICCGLTITFLALLAFFYQC